MHFGRQKCEMKVSKASEIVETCTIGRDEEIVYGKPLSIENRMKQLMVDVLIFPASTRPKE